jgi:hypothetical protein
MKAIYTITIVFFLSCNLFAICDYDGISLWPKKKEISFNSLFIIQGYGDSQDLIKELGKKKKVYLRCGNDKIYLDVLKLNIGQMSLTQAILKPRTKLIAGNSYSMYIEGINQNDYDNFIRNNTTWEVNNSVDTISPQWKSQPGYLNSNITPFGCGPAVGVRFSGEIVDRSDVWVYAKVKDLRENTTAEYYIIPDSLGLTIGHGMCSGAFYFLEKNYYEASFSLMDINGNFNTVETTPIKFIGPFMDGDNPFYTTVNTKKVSNAIYYYLVLGIAIMPIGIAILVLLLRRFNKQKRKG